MHSITLQESISSSRRKHWREYRHRCSIPSLDYPPVSTTEITGLDGRDFVSWQKFETVSCRISEVKSFFKGTESLIPLIILRDDEDDELDRVVFISYSAGLTGSWPSFSLNSFLRSLPSLVSTGLAVESTVIVKVKESGGFLPLIVLASSLKGTPTSLVAHTSKLGLHEPRDVVWAVFGFVASSIECQRCGLETDVPCAIALKLFAGTIRWGNRGEPRIFSREDDWLVLASEKIFSASSSQYSNLKIY